MANLADSIVFGDLTVTRDQLIKGTLTVEGLLALTGNVQIGNDLTVGGTVSGNGSGLTALNASNLSSGTVAQARLPAAALIGDTTYSAGTGLALSGTTFNISNPFNPSGSYGSLRAQATTKADVGLSAVPNIDMRNASNLSSGTVATARLPAAALVGDTTYSAGTGLALSGTTFNISNPFNPSGDYGSLRARGTLKGDVGLGSVRNVASYSQAESNNRYLRKDVSDTLTGDLTVTGEVIATDVTITSDLRVKSDLVKISSPLEGLLSLTGYTYRMKGLDKHSRRMGLGAQDVLKVFPEAVHGTEETHYSLSYGSLVAALVEGIKEQHSMIESLSKRLSILESK